MDSTLENIISAIAIGVLLTYAGFSLDTISLFGTNLIGIAVVKESDGPKAVRVLHEELRLSEEQDG